jgi:hypothetical protein
MNLFSELIIGTIGSLLAAALIRTWRSNRKRLIEGRPDFASHLRDLKGKINKMPFLYEDLEARVMDDYVDIKQQPLDSDTLRPPAQRKVELPTAEKLRNSRKVLFVGGAGIGKTTYQRFHVLRIIADQSKVEFLQSAEKPLPFFVPLRAVDNSVKFPILKYLCSSSPMLSSLPLGGAIRSLIKLAETGKLFLFLDGYDEIQFASATPGGGYIRDELNLMMGSTSLPKPADGQKHDLYKTFYDSLETCRIWLSSRREFFLQYPVSLFAPVKRQTVSAIELIGLGDKRFSLVRKIFEKYRGRANKSEELFDKFEELFDAEYFVHQIDTSTERELRSLSFNPLFLTIMCFIYAESVIKNKKYDVQWASSFNNLINKCIQLLLHELDERKVKEFSGAKLQALTDRRGEFVPEKEEFLRYFAFELFDEEKNFFDRSYVEEKARCFFKGEPRSPARERILAVLEDESVEKPPDIVWQLINTSIFIIVDTHGSTCLYDFPHLRFREMLAAEYLDKHKSGVGYLIDNLQEGSLNELLYVYFNRSSSQDTILEAIFAKLRNCDECEYYSKLLINCLEKKPNSYNPSPSIHRFFTDCLNCSAHFSISSEIFAYFSPSEDFVQFANRRFKESFEERKFFSLSLSSHILHRYNEGMLWSRIREIVLPKFDVADEVVVELILKHEEISEHLKKLECLTEDQRVFFRLKKMYTSILNKNGSDLGLVRDRRPEYCYIVTEETVKGAAALMKDGGGRLISPEEVEKLREIVYKVHFSNTFLGKKGDTKFSAGVKDFVLANSCISYDLYSDVMSVMKLVRQGQYFDVPFFK